MIAYELDLNLIPGGILPRLNVSQYDHGQTITCVLWDGNTSYSMPSGTTVSVAGTKPDGTGFTYECTLQNSQPVVTISEQMTAVAGDVMCELILLKSGKRQGTINFVMEVEPAALRSDVPISETDIPVLQQIPEYVAQASADADRAEQAAATAMSTDAGKVTDRLNLNNCRNLVVPADINYTKNGVTMRTNADGSITLSGANTRSDFVMMYDIMDADGAVATKKKWFPNGNYKLYGDTVGGRISDKAFFVFRKCDANGAVIGSATNASGSDATFSIDDTVKINMVTLYILANADFGTGMTIYPMITTQSTENVTGYEQGALSNRALTIKSEILDDLDAGEDSLMNEGIRYPVINGIRNYVDSNGVYHKNLGCVDLGAGAWAKVGTNRFNSNVVASLIKIPITAGEMPNIKCYKYTTDTFAHVYSEVDKTIAVAYSTISSAGNINIVDTAYSDSAAFKSAMSGVLLFYELETPQTWNTKSIVGLDALATTDKTLIGAINELNTHLNYTTYSTGINLTGSVATSLQYFVDVYGKFAILSMQVTTNELGANTWNLIGVLPENRRPPHVVFFSSNSTIWEIKTNGEINVYSPWGKITLTSERVCVTYPI